MSDIVVVGSLNMDMVVRTALMPGAGETLHGKEFHTIPGGKGANQALAIARLGGSVSMIGRVGQDGFGKALCKNLADNQVDITPIQIDTFAPTGVALIVVEDSGENRIIVIPGANHQTCPADIQAAENLIRQARMLVVQFEVPMPVVEAVVRQARRWNISVIVNAAPAYPIDSEWMPLIDYLVVNEHEASTLSGQDVSDVESARRAAQILIQRGARHVVLTLGAQGSVIGAPTGEYHVPSFPVKVIDTTAAGDAFIGGLAVSLLDSSLNLPAKVRFASAAGAIATTRMGAQSSLPTRAEVEAILAGKNE